MPLKFIYITVIETCDDVEFVMIIEKLSLQYLQHFFHVEFATFLLLIDMVRAFRNIRPFVTD